MGEYDLSWAGAKRRAAYRQERSNLEFRVQHLAHCLDTDTRTLEQAQGRATGSHITRLERALEQARGHVSAYTQQPEHSPAPEDINEFLLEAIACARTPRPACILAVHLHPSRYFPLAAHLAPGPDVVRAGRRTGRLHADVQLEPDEYRMYMANGPLVERGFIPPGEVGRSREAIALYSLLRERGESDVNASSTTSETLAP